MKILLSVRGLSGAYAVPSKAYRLIEWPETPQLGVKVYPFSHKPEEGVKIDSVEHFFWEGFVHISGMYDLLLLHELLEKEYAEWLLTTEDCYPSIINVARRLFQKVDPRHPG